MNVDLVMDTIMNYLPANDRVLLVNASVQAKRMCSRLPADKERVLRLAKTYHARFYKRMSVAFCAEYLETLTLLELDVFETTMATLSRILFLGPQRRIRCKLPQLVDSIRYWMSRFYTVAGPEMILFLLKTCDYKDLHLSPVTEAIKACHKLRQTSDISNLRNEIDNLLCDFTEEVRQWKMKWTGTEVKITFEMTQTARMREDFEYWLDNNDRMKKCLITAARISAIVYECVPSARKVYGIMQCMPTTRDALYRWWTLRFSQLPQF